MRVCGAGQDYGGCTGAGEKGQSPHVQGREKRRIVQRAVTPPTGQPVAAKPLRVQAWARASTHLPRLAAALQGAILATLVGHWRVLSPADVALLLLCAAGSACMLHLRRHAPASFARWRELSGLLLRLTLTSPASAATFLDVLRSWSFTGRWMHDVPTYAHALLACSGAPVVAVVVSEQACLTASR